MGQHDAAVTVCPFLSRKAQCRSRSSWSNRGAFGVQFSSIRGRRAHSYSQISLEKGSRGHFETGRVSPASLVRLVGTYFLSPISWGPKCLRGSLVGCRTSIFRGLAFRDPRHSFSEVV